MDRIITTGHIHGARIERDRGWSLTALLVVLTCLLLCACTRTDSRSNKTAEISSSSKSTLRRGIGGEPGSLDPAKAVDTFSFEVLRDCYEGLTAEGIDGSIVPGAASSWHVSEDGKQYEFTVRPNAKWSDGTPVLARDFVNAWRRVVDPKFGSPLADVLRPIDLAPEIIAGTVPPERLGVIAASDDKLIVKLHHPAPYFPQVLTHSATFPYKTQVIRRGSKIQLTSNGPYTVSDWVPGGLISAHRNSFYWDSTNVEFDSIIYNPQSNEDTEFNLYRGEQLDMTANVSVSALPIIRQRYARDLVVKPYLGIYYYAFNLRSGSLKDSVALRKALTLAIDRAILRETLLPFNQQLAYSLIPPGTFNYDQQSWDWKSAPQLKLREESQRLYRELGYSKDHPLKLRILINASPALKRITLAIASMWREALGVQCDIAEEEYRVFLDSRRTSEKWDVLRLGWTADFNDASNFLDLFRTNSPNNDSGYSNDAFDKLLDQAANSSNANQRKAILEQAERLLLTDYPIAPIYFYSSKRLIRPLLQGVDENPLNRIYSKHLHFNRHTENGSNEEDK